MEKFLIFILAVSAILSGCESIRNENGGKDFEVDKTLSKVFDSLIWLQYQCPDTESKTLYEWNWAYNVRETLGVEDMDSLTILTHEMNESYQLCVASPMTADMTTASEACAGTARFRMLNVYQALADFMAVTPLGDEGSYYKDYVLWEELYKEFEYWYKDKGNWRFIFLNDYYMKLADLRTKILREELSCLSNDRDSKDGWYNKRASHGDEEWMNRHPAICRWYAHRMKMSDKLQSRSLSQAQFVSALTYKQLTLYVEYQTEAEKEYNMEDE